MRFSCATIFFLILTCIASAKDYKEPRKVKLFSDGPRISSVGGFTTTLTNGTGQGSLTVVVTAYGEFGSSTAGDDAEYTQIGANTSTGTVYESAVWSNLVNGFFTAGGIDGPSLPQNAFTEVSSARAVSTFTVGGLDVVLEQALSPAGDRGSSLVQTYSFTNNGTESVSFDVIRHVDGDLYFDGTLSDSAGVRENGQLIYEFDSGDNASNPTTFFGIRTEGGTALGYRIAEYRFTGDILSQGRGVLTNTVENDTNADGFTDEDYDVTLSLGRQITVLPGRTSVFRTTTSWGEGAALADIEWDVERTQMFYGDDIPVRAIQVVDTKNEYLVAGKPTLVRGYIRTVNEGDPERSVKARLLLNETLFAEETVTARAKGFFDNWESDSAKKRIVSKGEDIIEFGEDGDLVLPAGDHALKLVILEGESVLLEKAINVEVRTPKRGFTVVRVPVHQTQDGDLPDLKPDPAILASITDLLEHLYPITSVNVIDVSTPVIMSGQVLDDRRLASRLLEWPPLSRTTTNGLIADLKRTAESQAREQINAAKERGDFVIIVGLTPSQLSKENDSETYGINGVTNPESGVTIVRSWKAAARTLCHEIGHLAPHYLDDTYYRASPPYAGSQAPGRDPLGVTRGGRSREDGAFNPSAQRDSNIKGDVSGVFILRKMGPFNFGYTNALVTQYKPGFPPIHESGVQWRGFMGNSSTGWAETNEYLRLASIYIPSEGEASDFDELLFVSSDQNIVAPSSIITVSGEISLSDQVRFSPVVYSQAGSNIPRVQSGQYYIAAFDDQGIEIDRAWFDVEFEVETPIGWYTQDAAPFYVTLKGSSTTVRELRLYDENDVRLASLTPSTAAPSIGLSPRVSSSLNLLAEENFTISWEASDSDGDNLYYDVEYSADGGATYSLLFGGLTKTSVSIDLDSLPAAQEAYFRVTASDGFNAASVIDGPFQISDKAPDVDILFPTAESALPEGESIVLAGIGFDREEGRLPDESLKWFVDDVEVGTGERLSIDSPEESTFKITLRGFDSKGNQSEVSLDIGTFDQAVTPVADPGADSLAIIGTQVALNGENSFDPNLDSLTYTWTQTSGPALSIQGSNTATPSFTMPALQPGEALTLALTVSDGVNSSPPTQIQIASEGWSESLSHYGNWVFQNFPRESDANRALPGIDYDNDSLTNYEEYLMFENPITAERRNMQVAVTPDPSSLQVTFNVRTAETNVSYSISYTDNFLNWEIANLVYQSEQWSISGNRLNIVSAVLISDGVWQITIADTAAVTSGTYLRIKANYSL